MSTDSGGARLLVMDDEPGISDFVAEVANVAGYRCLALSDPARFEAALDVDPALIFLDLMMPGIDGIEMLRMIAERNSRAGVVLMSGFDRSVLHTAAELAKTLGLRTLRHFQKPIRFAELEDFLRRQVAGTAKAAQKVKTEPTLTESDLARAIRDRELVLHYQPQIEIATGRLIGVEALVRWQHPQMGLIAPGAFIGLAEETGLIDALGWMVLRRGIADGSSFMRALGKMSISLNVSVHSLSDLTMPERLAHIADKHGVPRSNVYLEITESGLAQELAKTLDVLTRLRMKQIQLSIDDFGTGYSMMQQLRHVPATEIKIDRGFVQDAARDERARVIVEKTIEIGHELGMRVLAEGIETREQLEFLKDRGCDAAQGFFFCRPLPAAEFVSWARRWLGVD
jgi:EAL domain-containing protein (putative c-di-GMP-specific phosphodiesterase class I)